MGRRARAGPLAALALLLVLGCTRPVAAARVLAGAEPAAADAGANPGTTLDPAAVAGLGGEEAGAGVEMKIINGLTVNSTDFNFMAALFTGGRFFCGGVLISNDTVLTAAHCVVDTQLVDTPSALTVQLLRNVYDVERIYAHPGYSANTIPADNKDQTYEGALHDIAVLKLATQAADTPTVALATADTALEAGERLQVSGWGTTETGEASNVLKYAEVNYLPPSYCPSDYDDVLCGGGTGENTCNGDSGGPLMIRDAATRQATVVGITSHGPDCLAGPTFAYGYYTDVRKYLDAIGSWLVGQDYVWDGSSAPPAPTDTAAPTPPADLPTDFVPGPTEWQPVPGWPGSNGSGDGSSGSEGGDASPLLPSLDEIWCSLFPSNCGS